MSHRGPLTAVITAVLGATLGGLLIWRVYRTKRKRLPSIQKVADSLHTPEEKVPEFTAVEYTCIQPPRVVEKGLQTVQCQTTLPARIPSSDQLLGIKPVIVSSEEEWQQLWPVMQKELSVFPVLGFDCEWVKTSAVSAKGRAAVVSLLQMASYSGLCVLVRLLSFRSRQQPFPHSLVEVLRNPHILKVGVGCYEDGKRLTRDYGLSLTCTVDLRHLALRQKQTSVNNGLSLKSLAADVLSISLDKSPEVRCSDWEADQLTQEQMTYAARDAQVSIALFLHLLGFQSEAGPASSSGSSYSELSSRCQGLVDVPFKGQGERDDGAGDGDRKKRARSLGYENPESGDQQVSDPRRNPKRKSLGAGYSARKSPLYDNCFLHAPDGQPLCTCDKKKAKWYLDKGIGAAAKESLVVHSRNQRPITVVAGCFESKPWMRCSPLPPPPISREGQVRLQLLESEEPFIVRLLFEPSGRPDSQQDYYLTAKENLCVVCGKADSYIRKNIVPHEYRRHFPTEMKDHNSHDILLLCTSCHAASNVHDSFLKQQLAEEFSAPQGCEEGVRTFEDSDRRKVRSAARALLTAGEGLPDQRREELQALVRSFLNMNDEQELTEEALQEAASLETKILNEAYVPHGLKVVRAHAEHGLRGLMVLERRWRQHFLTTMQPHHLPPLWSVDHNHSKFLRKYGEDLPIKLN